MTHPVISPTQMTKLDTVRRTFDQFLVNLEAVQEDLWEDSIIGKVLLGVQHDTLAHWVDLLYKGFWIINFCKIFPKYTQGLKTCPNICDFNAKKSNFMRKTVLCPKAQKAAKYLFYVIKHLERVVKLFDIGPIKTHRKSRFRKIWSKKISGFPEFYPDFPDF